MIFLPMAARCFSRLRAPGNANTEAARRQMLGQAEAGLSLPRDEAAEAAGGASLDMREARVLERVFEPGDREAKLAIGAGPEPPSRAGALIEQVMYGDEVRCIFEKAGENPLGIARHRYEAIDAAKLRREIAIAQHEDAAFAQSECRRFEKRPHIFLAGEMRQRVAHAEDRIRSAMRKSREIVVEIGFNRLDRARALAAVELGQQARAEIDGDHPVEAEIGQRHRLEA